MPRDLSFHRKEAAEVRQATSPESVGATKSARGINATAPRRQAALELALVENLKRQVACLEMEVATLKAALAHPSHTCQDSAAWQKIGGSSLPVSKMSHVDPRTLRGDAAKDESEEGGGVQCEHQSLLHADTASPQLNVDRPHLDEVVGELHGRKVQLRGMLSVANAGLQRDLCAPHETLQGGRGDLEDKIRVRAATSAEALGAAFGDDLANEAEYYRIQTYRLRVSQRESLARIEVLEKQLSDERNQTAALKSNLRTAMQEVQRLRQAEASRTSMCERMDESYTRVCALLRMAVEDCDALHQQLQLQLCHSDTLSASSSFSIGETLRGLERISSHIVQTTSFGIESNRKSRNEPEAGSFWGAKDDAADSLSSVTLTTTVPMPPAAAAAVPMPPAAAVPMPPAAAVPMPPIMPEQKLDKMDYELYDIDCKVHKAEEMLRKCIYY